MTGAARYEGARPAREGSTYRALFAALLIAYLLAGFVLPALSADGESVREVLFGFSQAGRFPVLVFFAALCAAALAVSPRYGSTGARLERIRKLARSAAGNFWFRLAFSLLMVAVFFALRNNFVNYDGRMFAEKFARDIPLRGAHVTHDEMWELYLHSRFWFYTGRLFGWSVELSYQVLSSVAGGVFVFLLLDYCLLVFHERPLLAFALAVSGGYMQLFFGDVENYTLTATLIMAYFLASALYIKRRTGVMVPAVLLAVAMTFHLLSGFLIPSMLVLFRVEKGRGGKGRVLAAAALFCAIIGGTLLFFHLSGLPIRDLWYHSHAFGHGGHIRPRLVDPSPAYYFRILNLSFLLVPVWIMLVPRFVFAGPVLDELGTHLLVASAFMALFALSWKATLGVYEDWNMFAAAAIPVTLLVLRNLIVPGGPLRKGRLLYMFILVFMLHSFSWVLYNHFHAGAT